MELIVLQELNDQAIYESHTMVKLHTINGSNHHTFKPLWPQVQHLAEVHS